MLGLVNPDSGEILYKGKDLAKLSDAEFRPLHADLQMVFQDTLSSLNPQKPDRSAAGRTHDHQSQADYL